MQSLRLLAPLLLGAALTVGCASPYQGSPSPHFDGTLFSNPGFEKTSSVAGYLWLRLNQEQAPWPEVVTFDPSPPPPAAVDDGTARVTFVGHATLLIQVAGLNILTDPLWSQRASPFDFIGPKRVTQPGVDFDDLPRIDVVLISHNHFDHLDLPTLRRLDERDKPRVIVPLGNRPLVARTMRASDVTEHDWGATVALPRGAVLHLEPMLHGSGRTPFDQQRTLWAAFVLHAAGLKLYHVGDSGYGDGGNFRAAAAKHGGFDLAMLPIGAYEPASFMADSHMSPAQAVQAAVDAQASRALAHHFGAFPIGFESFDAPRQELAAALKAASMPADAFPALEPGQSITVRPARPPS